MEKGEWILWLIVVVVVVYSRSSQDGHDVFVWGESGDPPAIFNRSSIVVQWEREEEHNNSHEGQRGKRTSVRMMCVCECDA